MPLVRGSRGVAALGSVAAVALATVVLTAPAAEAADPVTTLLPGVTEVGDVAAGGGHIVVAAGDRVVVTDSAGVVKGTVTNLPGAVGLALSPDAGRAYVALRDANQVAEVDTVRRTVLRRIDLPSAPCPRRLALAGTRLWVGFGCNSTSDGGVAGLDLGVARPTPVVVASGLYNAPVLAAAGSVLAYGVTGMSPAYAEVFTVGAGGALTRRGSVSADSSNLQDLALSPDGRLLATAFGYPYRHVAFDTTTLAEVRSYGERYGWFYPNSVAFSPDGSRLAAGRGFGPDLSVHDTATAATYYSGSTDGDPVAGTLAFSGNDVVSVQNSWPDSTFRLSIARGTNGPAAAVSFATPPPATAGAPLALRGRLVFSGGAAPGPQRLTVTRLLPDDTSTALPAVVTAADGSFTIRDVPPAGGGVTYTAEWAGTPARLGTTGSVAVPVAKVAVTLTLAGPAAGAAGQPVTLSGTARVGGAVPAPPMTLGVWRTTTNNYGLRYDYVTDVTTSATGTFSFTDTPPEGGQVAYQVRSDGTAAQEAGETTSTVTVSSRAARLLGSVQDPAYVREPYTVTGEVQFQTGACVGPLTLQVTRQVGTGAAQARPDVRTDAACRFGLTDTLTAPADVRYTLRWAGDATHVAATREVTGQVTAVPVSVSVVPREYEVRPGQAVVVDGKVTYPTGRPLAGRPVTVTRTGAGGATVTLPALTTGTDGTFVLTDTPPAVPAGDARWFRYEFRWAGDATYAAADGQTAVTVLEAG